MGALLSPSTPSVPSPAPPPPAAAPATMANSQVQAAGRAKKAAGAISTGGSTNPTGAAGDLSKPPVAKATLLGEVGA